jgi:signal transduction histidine kinase
VSADGSDEGGPTVDREFVRDAMRRLALFADLGASDLDQLVEMARTRTVAAGETLIREGEAGDTMFVIVEGELEVSKGQGSQATVLAVRGPGDVVGEMALLEHAPRSATLRALSPTRLLVIDQEAFGTLLSCSTTAAPTILSTITTRLRSTESLLMHQAKLAALGTMAAGLAHELNNPAAAILRSTDQLGRAVVDHEEATRALARHALDVRQGEALATLARPASAEAPVAGRERARREEEVEAWLEQHGFDEAWSLAPALVAGGWQAQALAASLGAFDGALRADVVRWLATRALVQELLHEAQVSAEAISGIVGAVKRYSYLDQAPVQEIDVHEGLETTLVIMRHSLREGVEVVRHYASDVPRIEAYGSELNQVWTNLIDNAVDAMEGRGTLTIRTTANDREVCVEIHDSGPGIPEEVLPRLFEPFFTTKGVGDGTGLGLHIVYTIVVNRHHGRVDVRSEPGDTCFRVTLPRSLSGR